MYFVRSVFSAQTPNRREELRSSEWRVQRVHHVEPCRLEWRRLLELPQVQAPHVALPCELWLRLRVERLSLAECLRWQDRCLLLRELHDLCPQPWELLEVRLQLPQRPRLEAL